VAGVDRRFRALLCAHAVSAYGNYLHLIALSLFAYEVTGGALGVGLVMALRLAAGFLSGLAAGALAGAVGRRTLMISADLAQAAVLTVLALRAEEATLPLLAGVVVVLGAGNTLFSVALRSAVPVMVGHDRRADANGLLVTFRSFATVLGFASATPVIALGGYPTAFAINAASFVVSAAALLLLRPRTDGEDPGREPAAEAEAERWRDGDGRRRWRGLPGVASVVLAMILLRGTDALASSSHNVALPVLAQQTAPDQPALLMTQFWSAWAVGTVIAHQVVKRSRTLQGGAGGERAFALGTCAMSLFFIAAFTGLPGIGLMLVALGAGLADGYTEIVYTTRLQAAPDRLRSRLFGFSAMAETAGFTLGAVTAAAALEALPVWAVVSAFHGLALCGAIALLLFRTVHTDSGAVPSQRTGEEREDTHEARTGAGPVQGT
jgi:MFS family permease